MEEGVTTINQESVSLCLKKPMLMTLLRYKEKNKSKEFLPTTHRKPWPRHATSCAVLGLHMTWQFCTSIPCALGWRMGERTEAVRTQKEQVTQGTSLQP